MAGSPPDATPAPDSPLRAVTFDFWSTLVVGTLPEEIMAQRRVERLARLHGALSGAGLSLTPEQLSQAFRRAGQRISAEHKATLRDVGPPGRWAVLAAELGVPEGVVAYDVVEPIYEDITLEWLPDLTPYVDQAVRTLKTAGYRLGVICNTGLAGGRVLRQVLDRYDLLSAFDMTVWSNELGWSKPHPEIFRHALDQLGGDIQPGEALHVGDLEEVDVKGALDAGMYSALYAPDFAEGQTSRADVVVRDWRDFPALLRQLPARAASRAS